MAGRIGSPKIRAAFAFLQGVSQNGTIFTIEELADSSGWSLQTATSMASKRLRQFLKKVDGGYQAQDLAHFTEEAFCRLCSQSSVLATDPLRPRLDPDVEELIEKARDSALAAVQSFNCVIR